MSRSRNQKLKARDKVTQKMSRDGLVERNAATGENARISKRDMEFDLRGDMPESLSKLGTRTDGKKSRKSIHRQNQSAPQANTAEIKQDAALQVNAQVQETAESSAIESHIDGTPDERRRTKNTETPRSENSPPQKKRESYQKPPNTDLTPGTPNRRKLHKAQKQADRATKKLETAKSKLPSAKKLRSKTIISAKSDKAKHKLYFEGEVKPKPAHLKDALPLRPGKMAGNTAIAYGHRKMYQLERENVAIEAAHKGGFAAEGFTRFALRHHKTAPYRKARKLERKSVRKSINLTYQKVSAENPKLKSNLLSRALQKRKIKKDYAKAAREAKKTAEGAKKAGSMVTEAGKAAIGIVKRHPIPTAVVILISLLIFMLTSLIGVFSSAGGGGLGGILTASYLAEDTEIDKSELAYTEWETDLQMQIVETETSHPGYDEYRYNIGDVSHNPHELIALLTVLYQNFLYDDVSGELQALFNEQYTLTFTQASETRYADPTDADNDGDYEPYSWNVLTTVLTARPFSDIAATHLSGGQLAHYAVLMQSKGARQYIANPFDFDWLPYVTSYYGYRIHPISGEKNYHKGLDIGAMQGTEIHAGHGGTVTIGYDADGFGNYVTITGADGLVSNYAHCDSILIADGQNVTTGDIIATVGNTGNSTGPHLHLEILKNGQYLNPLFYLLFDV